VQPGIRAANSPERPIQTSRSARVGASWSTRCRIPWLVQVARNKELFTSSAFSRGIRKVDSKDPVPPLTGAATQ